MTFNDIYTELKRLAPNVCFGTSKSLDDMTTWDGEPENNPSDTMSPYNIDVYAKTIIGGVEVEGTSSMGGTWMEPDEEIGDIGGYLPQMLEDAAANLKMEIGDQAGVSSYRIRITDQLDAVIAFLKNEMRMRYDAQMKR